VASTDGPKPKWHPAITSVLYIDWIQFLAINYCVSCLNKFLRKKTVTLSTAFITTGKPLAGLSQRISHHSHAYEFHKRSVATLTPGFFCYLLIKQTLPAIKNFPRTLYYLQQAGLEAFRISIIADTVTKDKHHNNYWYFYFNNKNTRLYNMMYLCTSFNPKFVIKIKKYKNMQKVNWFHWIL